MNKILQNEIIQALNVIGILYNIYYLSTIKDMVMTIVSLVLISVCLYSIFNLQIRNMAIKRGIRR